VVSNNTFIGTLPDTIDASWTDMVLIDLAFINDLYAYGRGIVNVFLYAKPIGNGIKNVKTLFEMESKLNDVINGCDGTNMMITKLDTDADYDDLVKWHFNVVRLNLTII
jgi:hypothetical protein